MPYNYIATKVAQNVEWITINIATALATVWAWLGFENFPFGQIASIISLSALAFYNIVRGLKTWEEYKQTKRENERSSKDTKGT